MGIPSTWGAGNHRLWSFRDKCLLLDHAVETIQFWRDPSLTSTLWWPRRSWAAHFWSQGAPKGTFGPESPFGHPAKLARRPLCQAEENFAWWEGKQTRGNDAVQWGFKQQIMGIQSAKIKSTRELIAAAGQCSWQRSPSQNHVQRMSKAATDGTWSC